MKTVSIIIPIYKVEEDVKRCLLSVLHQNYLNLELIIVNDCSPDSSFEIVKQVCKSSQFPGDIKLLSHTQNLGPSAARNTGIENASGEYLFFVDSDDELRSDTVISDLMELASKHDYPEVVLGNFYRISGDRIVRTLNLQEKFYSNNEVIFTEYAYGKLWITPWGKLVARSTIVNNELYFKPGIYHEDELWGFLLFRTIQTLYVTTTVVYLYYEKDGSITSVVKSRNLQDITTVILEMYDIYCNQPQNSRETCIAIERARRSLLKKLMLFPDRELKKELIRKLQSIKLPLWATKKTSYMRQNFLLRLPTSFVLQYLALKLRWK